MTSWVSAHSTFNSCSPGVTKEPINRNCVAPLGDVTINCKAGLSSRKTISGSVTKSNTGKPVVLVSNLIALEK
jgi:hypothetical protein